MTSVVMQEAEEMGPMIATFVKEDDEVKKQQEKVECLFAQLAKARATAAEIEKASKTLKMAMNKTIIYKNAEQ